MTRPTWDEYFASIAVAVSARSIDPQTKVGAVIVGPDKRIRSCGYNGFPPGFPDGQLPLTRPAKYPYMVHAEANAIATASSSLRDCTLYCTHSPCVECAKLIVTAGITRVVSAEDYIRGDVDVAAEILWLGGVA